MIRTTALALAAIAGLASADTVVLDIDSGQSSINVNATLATPVGTDTDNGSSTISGTIEIELDDYGAPAAITLVDFMILLDSNIALNFDYGFLGSANTTLNNAMAMYGAPGTPVGPVGVSGAAFSFPDVPTELGGTVDYTYSFFLVGSGADTFALSDFGLFSAPIGGDVTADGQHVTLDGTIDIDVTQPVLDGLATLTLTGSATLSALGDAPVAGGCNPADLEPPYGTLDLMDIQTFIDAFLLMIPTADLDGNGVYDLNDLQAFVAAFLAGCP